MVVNDTLYYLAGELVEREVGLQTVLCFSGSKISPDTRGMSFSLIQRIPKHEWKIKVIIAWKTLFTLALFNQ